MRGHNGYEFDRRIRFGEREEPSSDLPGISPEVVIPFLLAGVDEAGRGPLAGPVVAAAVILPPTPQLVGLRDSKVVPEEQREALFIEIKQTALAFAVAIVDNKTIDSMNILQASLKAMRDALSALKMKPDVVLVDGNQKCGTNFREVAVIKGDSKSASVMAASILAKVTRDQLMKDLHEIYPQYGFDEHKGYAAPKHLEALQKYGPCPHHRFSFSPIRQGAEPDLLEI